MFQNKGHDKINYNRTTESKKGEVNEIHSDSGSANAKFFPPPFTNTKCLLLKPAYDPCYHITNIVKIKRRSFDMQPPLPSRWTGRWHTAYIFYGNKDHRTIE